ncbi:hypothetical protein SEPB62_05985 [Salmonella enterica subsp. enterica serovar Paratyphi B str. SARA62]|nr:hypothetical protein SEPB62_05985 [Salmonella enterica subsp. enterica serovar Paratyphi B str. SARA62]ESG00180.1 hypothetical protein SEEPB585_15944 [Salmonella enterica subsp. enterica serovar Paratyphi B str. ATCC BAA-1585]
MKSVYPRWRGEHKIVEEIWITLVGLSPLARGTPQLDGDRISFGRFIPAGAGNTNSEITRIYRVAVYPRWRGEHGYDAPSASV